MFSNATYRLRVKHIGCLAFAAMFSWMTHAAAEPSNVPHNASSHISSEGHSHLRADGHAPIGVMGDHLHKRGEWMLSYRFMRMWMEGNRIGENDVSAETIVTTVPNRFAGSPTLRIVPTQMSMDMHMFGAMYAPADSVTLMAMVNYMTKKMNHTTFAGMMGANKLGTFTTKSAGFGDVRLSALIRLYKGPIHKVHLNAGLSLPTGSITKRDDVLTPMGTTPTLRLPYAMQLGSGTFDALPGITYLGRVNKVSWGAQYRATLRLEGENDEGYRLGNIHQLTAWLAYQWQPWISTSLRVLGRTQDQISGLDTNITAPVQTANPDYYGGENVDLLLGLNLIGQHGLLRGHRLAFEVGAPIHQNLNGPQMKSDWHFTVGWQKAF